ncbi:MAG: aldo/keto reductase, partial [Planctomycetota bacterium]|nr:aldo/keto reductase [Planctomycetota bacterium]
MQYQRLGKSNLLVSSIGLGCVTFGREIDEATSFDVLDRAAERGINLLDTAAVYGDGSSETVIGRWLRARGARDQLVIATKVSGRLTQDHIINSVEGSLRRLDTDHIDLLQAHGWDDRTPLDETLAAFDNLVRRGEVRFCGCSNWEPCHLEQALSLATDNTWSRLESVQPPYSLVDRRIEQGLLELCGDRGLGVIAYSPLAAGFLTGKYRRDAAVPAGTRFDVIPGHQNIYFTDHGFRVMERLRALADEVRIPMAHLALAWVLNRPGISSILIGARHPRQVDQVFEPLQ